MKNETGTRRMGCREGGNIMSESIGTVSGPDFIALQVRDVEAAAQFYESRLGLTRGLHHLTDPFRGARTASRRRSRLRRSPGKRDGTVAEMR